MEKQILIVENSQEYIQLLQGIVEGVGYQALVAQRATDALKIIEESIISLILLDIKMPSIWGHQFLQYIRKQGKRIPVIVISGFLTPEVLEVLRDNQVNQILVKPFTVKRVVSEIKQVLD